MPQPPSGTVSFLFTDLEGSTRLWEEQPDAMRSALGVHDELLRQAIEAHGGYVFSTAGDAFAAAFGRAADAVGAAVDGQRALHSERWPGGILLRVRMGIHTGEAVERDGDYF
ncbi:MAG TPA: adenylate/guanylate cyclase domain-containing protein, partial [Acidimicrobiia bacterium]|nr:adenylate/guanylate cyclase domain-containing protein [Acidimicrobiia bacterium]